jgi:hypothetical protein
LAVGFHKPHVPLKFPREFLTRYPQNSVPVLQNASLFKPELMPAVAWESYDDVRSRDDVTALNVPWPFGPLPVAFTKLVRQAYAACVRCAFSDTGLHSRMPLDPTHVRLKLMHACDQWHSSRVSTALTCRHCKLSKHKWQQPHRLQL